MANIETINHDLLQRMVKANAVRKASVIGQRGGWSVIVTYGMEERALSVRRGGVRLFKQLDTVRDYLHGLGLPDFEVHGSGYESAQTRPKRSDASENMRRIHEAGEHDRWFRSEVEKTIKAVDSGEMALIPHDEVIERLRASLKR